jgi:hypothetical protein
MTSELPDAAGADDDAAAAVRETTGAIDSGRSQPTSRRRFRRANFLKLSSEQFLLTCILLVAFDAVAGFQVRKFFVLTTLDQQSLIHGLLSGVMQAFVCLTTNWALGQRSVDRAGRYFAALILAVAGSGALMHARIGFGIAAGATIFLVTAFLIERLQRRSFRLLHASRPNRQMRIRFQISLRTLLEVTVVVSVFFAIRLAFKCDWYGPYDPVRQLVGIATSQGAVPAVTAFAFVVAWFAVDRFPARALLMTFLILLNVGNSWSALGNMPNEYVAMFLLRISLPTYSGFAVAMVVALTLAGRVYGLRLVRVATRVRRSIEPTS